MSNSLITNLCEGVTAANYSNIDLNNWVKSFDDTVIKWEHPYYKCIMDEMVKFNRIKYSSYRLAFKMELLQKRTLFHGIQLIDVIGTFRRFALRSTSNDSIIHVSAIQNLIYNIFRSAYGSRPKCMINTHCIDITMSLILSIYDGCKSGNVQVLSLKVILVLLCNSDMTDKFSYLYSQVVDYVNCLSRKRLGLLLKDIAQVAEYFNEVASFGIPTVAHAVDSCFRKIPINRLASQKQFFKWFAKQPESLGWYFAFTRLKETRNVTHFVRCHTCKKKPFMGFRFRCVQCINCTMCQHCYLYELCTDTHDGSHPVREYYNQVTSKERREVVSEIVCNNIRKSKVSGLKSSCLQFSNVTPANSTGNLLRDSLLNIPDSAPITILRPEAESFRPPPPSCMRNQTSWRSAINFAIPVAAANSEIHCKTRSQSHNPRNEGAPAGSRNPLAKISMRPTDEHPGRRGAQSVPEHTTTAPLYTEIEHLDFCVENNPSLPNAFNRAMSGSKKPAGLPPTRRDYWRSNTDGADRLSVAARKTAAIPIRPPRNCDTAKNWDKRTNFDILAITDPPTLPPRNDERPTCSHSRKGSLGNTCNHVGVRPIGGENCRSDDSTYLSPIRRHHTHNDRAMAHAKSEAFFRTSTPILSTQSRPANRLSIFTRSNSLAGSESNDYIDLFLQGVDDLTPVDLDMELKLSCIGIKQFASKDEGCLQEKLASELHTLCYQMQEGTGHGTNGNTIPESRLMNEVQNAIENLEQIGNFLISY